MLFMFFILFSLCQKNEGLTTWILVSLFSLTKDSKDYPLENSLSQHIGGYILCGTSRGYIYLGIVILRTREGTSLVYQFKWRVHPHGYSKRTREGTSLVDLWLVKDFTRFKEISRTAGCLGTECRHGLWPNQYKSCVCLLLSYTL